MKLVDAVNTNDAVTENGMPTHSTSGIALTDFFFKIGGFRKSPSNDVITAFAKVHGESALYALKALFYARDIRGGMGERKNPRLIYQWLANNHPSDLQKNMDLIPFFGRYDDLEVFLDTPLESDALDVWVEGLANPQTEGLAAKWMPRKGPWFKFLSQRVGVSKKELRHALVAATNVVETQMCNREWGAIEYEKVPSQASLMYRKAFSKRDGTRYAAYLQAVQKGDAKINASTLYPSDIVSKVFQGESGMELNALWANLPDVFNGNYQSILPVCDVSGSMSGEPLNVSIGLGLYLAERNKSVFHNTICTFSSKPQLVQIQSKNIVDKVNELNRVPWEMNTDLEAVFNMILSAGLYYKIPESEMPRTILIISDMQFDQAIRNGNASAMQMIRGLYQRHGYEVPKVVFWNVRTSSGIPAKFNENGVGLVSGYSPNIMKSVLKGVTNPLDLVLETLDNERYGKVRV